MSEVSVTNHISEMSVVVCTDLCGKALHRQVGVGIVVTSGSLRCVMVAHWPGMPEIWVQIPALGIVFPIFVIPMTLSVNNYCFYYYSLTVKHDSNRRKTAQLWRTLACAYMKCLLHLLN